jgi:hypothetical protein
MDGLADRRMTALSIIVGAAIVWLAVSPFAAVLLGRAMKLADTKTPPPGMRGEAAPGRRAHLRAVR